MEEHRHTEPIDVYAVVDQLLPPRTWQENPLLWIGLVVAVFMSAGGHTALTIAGGQWSPALFAQHCEAHLEEDFQSCVGLITRLTGGMFDGVKKWAARGIIRSRFADAAPHAHSDPRVAAVVASVPACADFEMSSLAVPRVPLALVTAQQDRWLVPRFHSDRVLAACQTCCRNLPIQKSTNLPVTSSASTKHRRRCRFLPVT